MPSLRMKIDPIDVNIIVDVDCVVIIIDEHYTSGRDAIDRVRFTSIDACL